MLTFDHAFCYIFCLCYVLVCSAADRFQFHFVAASSALWILFIIVMELFDVLVLRQKRDEIIEKI